MENPERKQRSPAEPATANRLIIRLPATGRGVRASHRFLADNEKRQFTTNAMAGSQRPCQCGGV